MVTPDLRFPQGDTRAAQQADFAIQSCEIPQVRPAILQALLREPPGGNDSISGPGWGWSNYDFVRFHRGANGRCRHAPATATRRSS